MDAYPDSKALANQEVPVLRTMREKKCRNNEKGGGAEKWNFEIANVEHPASNQGG